MLLMWPTLIMLLWEPMTLTMIQLLNSIATKKMIINNSCWFFAFTTATQNVYFLPGLSLTLLSITVF